MCRSTPPTEAEKKKSTKREERGHRELRNEEEETKEKRRSHFRLGECRFSGRRRVRAKRRKGPEKKTTESKCETWRRRPRSDDARTRRLERLQGWLVSASRATSRGATP
ncbi:hypothetical protein TGP89_360280 [Toxoplasma gondii p89]|uniref:Uncharacterized protein n=2 Tax=Toxoplasma gondii TaxID=5811 RepID=A0A086JSI9_TOXGO|nr:hypothetical protein TGFOU_360280 [Toxoplasma gondii FOU]KFG37281.1 hypothetical protein TGP89_360280 [Toxoplasma gondii p89]